MATCLLLNQEIPLPIAYNCHISLPKGKQYLFLSRKSPDLQPSDCLFLYFLWFIEPTKHSPSSPSEQSTFLLENSSTSAAEKRCQSAVLICVLGFQLCVIISACDYHNSPNQLVKLSLGEHTRGRWGEGTPGHCTLHHM